MKLLELRLRRYFRPKDGVFPLMLRHVSSNEIYTLYDINTDMSSGKEAIRLQEIPGFHDPDEFEILFK